MTTAALTIWGNYGELTVDRFSGAVLSYTPEDPAEAEYADIARFDVNEAFRFYGAEWDRYDRWDVVEVGFWTTGGDYIPAEDIARAPSVGEAA